MIIDTLERSVPYCALGERLAAGLKWLASTDLTALELGRHDIIGSELWAGVSEYETKPLEEGAWEAHRKYVDIQYMVRGNERIGWTDIDRLHVTEAYSEERDVEWLEGNGDLFLLSEGAFVILFPQDAHMPQIAVDGPAEVRKVVVKVAI